MEYLALDVKKELCILQLTDDLPVLRARLKLSQEEVASRIGISRQTYNSIESKRRPMTWSTCVSLMMLFGRNEQSRKLMASSNICGELLNEIMEGK